MTVTLSQPPSLFLKVPFELQAPSGSLVKTSDVQRQLRASWFLLLQIPDPKHSHPEVLNENWPTVEEVEGNEDLQAPLSSPRASVLLSPAI